MLWATTEAGNRQALDRAPDPDGSVWAYKDGTGRWRARSPNGDGPDRYGYERVFMPHVASCLRTRRHPAARRPASRRAVPLVPDGQLSLLSLLPGLVDLDAERRRRRRRGTTTTR